MTGSIKTESHVMRLFAVMLLTSFLLAVIAVAVPIQTALAGGTSCYPWERSGCCDSAWPCRQDYYKRQCWNLGNYWTEYSCDTVSLCDDGC